jgi:hypothetical protein
MHIFYLIFIIYLICYIIFGFKLNIIHFDINLLTNIKTNQNYEN